VAINLTLTFIPKSENRTRGGRRNEVKLSFLEDVTKGEEKRGWVATKRVERGAEEEGRE